jgi:hypothetical protein
LPIPVVLHVLRATASALAYAHERGIVHRDVKSANIMVDTEGRAVVSDFGIARAVEEPQLTATGAVVGTPYFMSPEQCGARRIGPQSDQYSLGVVAFQMLTGTVPFSADTLPGIMHHHFYTPVPALRAARVEIPPVLDGIVQRLLAKKAEHRYASTQALADAVFEIPLSEPERREAARILRDLAVGTPMPRVDVAKLPPLQTSVRLTPAEGSPIGRRKQLPRPIVAGAGGVGIILMVLAGWLSGSQSEVGTGDPGADSAVTRTEASLGPATDGRSGDSSEPRGPGPGRGATQPTAPPASTASRPPAGAPAAGREAVTEANGSHPPAARQPASDASGVNAADGRKAATGSTGLTGRGGGTAAAERAPGKLRLSAVPSTAAIYVDDVLLNQGVVIDVKLAPGSRRLRIEAPGYETHTSTIEIVSGETLIMPRITLTPRGDGP